MRSGVSAVSKWKKSLFSNAAVRALSNEMHFVQLDLTEFTEEQKNLLDRFQLAGPPAILFLTRKVRRFPLPELPAKRHWKSSLQQ